MSASAEYWVDQPSLHFKSESDALFARLSLQLPTSSLDAVLQVLRNPAFRPSDLSFHTATDIYQHVSSHWITAVLNRQSTDARIPHLVLLLLVDHLQESEEFYSNSQNWDADHTEITRRLRADLINMSLVNRSWASVVQRLLFTKAILSEKNMPAFLFSPACGPCLKHISFRHDQDTYIQIRNFVHYPALFKCAPNVSSLHLSVEAFIDVDWQVQFGGIPSLLQALPYLQHLSYLHLQAPAHWEAPLLMNFCKVLPQLQNLSTLAIENWSFGSKIGNEGRSSFMPPALKEQTPPPSLKTISLVQRNFHKSFRVDLMTWLLGARDHFCPKILILRFAATQADGLTVLAPPSLLTTPLASTLPLLETLSLSLDRYNGLVVTQELLQRCKSLKVLRFRHFVYDTIPALTLPQSVEHVFVSVVWPEMFYKLDAFFEANVSPPMTKLSKFTTKIVGLTIDLSESELENAKTMLHSICRKHAIELELCNWNEKFIL